MAQFEEPEVVARFDRSYGDKKEELRLERGSYQGKPTFCLRLYWQTPDGAWRWAAQKPTTSGKCWERLNLKHRELEELGQALIQAAAGSDLNRPRPVRPRVPPYKREPVEPLELEAEDNIPF